MGYPKAWWNCTLFFIAWFWTGWDESVPSGKHLSFSFLDLYLRGTVQSKWLKAMKKLSIKWWRKYCNLCKQLDESLLFDSTTLGCSMALWKGLTEVPSSSLYWEWVAPLSSRKACRKWMLNKFRKKEVCNCFQGCGAAVFPAWISPRLRVKWHFLQTWKHSW